MTPRASALKDFISLLLRFIGQTASPAWHSRMGADTPLIRGALQPPEQWRGRTMLLPGSGGEGVDLPVVGDSTTICCGKEPHFCVRETDCYTKKGMVA